MTPTKSRIRVFTIPKTRKAPQVKIDMSEDRLCTVKVDWFQPVTNPPVKRFIVQFKTDKNQW